MELRVLGPVQVVTTEIGVSGESTTIDFDGPLAALLTVLALRRGSRVSKQYLHEAVWQGAVGLNAVETTVARVRQRLGLTAKDTRFLITERSAYRLVANTDVMLFEQRAKHGDEAFETGEYEEALSVYDSVLALWRGRPGADLLDDALEEQPVMAELATWHWSVQVNRLAALESLERWATALRGADKLLALEPHSDRVVAVRCRAIARLRGPAAAYDALVGTFRTMRDEQGLEPSKELRDLRDDLLADMAAADTSEGDDPGGAEPVVLTGQPDSRFPGMSANAVVDHNLPASTYMRFVPRPQWSRVEEGFAAGLPVIALVGIGGNGKSTLAREFAFELAEAGQPFKVIVWVSDKEIPGSTTLNLVLDEIALTAGVRELTTPSQQGKIQQISRMLRQSPTLIVIDNYETIVDQDLKNWIPTVPFPSRVLITSIVRPRSLDRFSLEIEVGGMGERERHDFLSQLLIRHNLRDLSPDTIGLSRIWQAAHGNPKLVEWAVGQYRSRGRQLDAIAREIGDTRSRAEAERRGQDFVLKELFRASWTVMTDHEAQVLMAASYFPHGCAVETLREVAACDDYFEDTIESLSDLCFLSRQSRNGEQSPWYVAEPLARIRLTGKFHIETKAIEDRWLAYWIRVTSAVGFCPGDVSRLSVLDVPGARENLEYAVYWAFETGRFNDVIRITKEARYYYYVRGLWSEEKNIHLLRAVAAQRNRDYAEEFDARVYFINIAAKQENVAAVEKQLQRLADLMEGHIAELTDRSMAEYRHAYALYLLAMREYVEAENQWRRNIEHPDVLGPANYNANLRWMAICIARSGREDRVQEALDVFTLAREHANEYGYARARFLIDLERAAITLGQNPSRYVVGQTLELLSTADVRQQLKLMQDRRYEADHQWLLALCHESLDDVGAAMRCRKKAADLYDALGLVDRATSVRQ